MSDNNWVRRIPALTLPKLTGPSLDKSEEGRAAEDNEDRPASPSSETWRSRIPRIHASIAENINSGINSATSFLSHTAKGDSRPEGTDDSSWKRRIAGLSAHLTQPFYSSNPAIAQGIVLAPEVQKALKEGHAVVALESTIISHGMPYPQNLETALEVEQIIRDDGAIPATVAILEGVPHVGLNRKQLEHIASRGLAVRKASRRDMPFILAQRLDGATTVSATMLLAARAGISVFVTGGIGGVHRGGESSMDVSADLTELGRTPVTVICAGAKSILDIPRTLEYLETQGVTVAAYQTDEFPAFFNPSSGCRADCRVDDPQAAANLIRASQQLNLGSGVLIGVPIPQGFAAEGAEIERATQRALQEAASRKLSGADTTPFLLKRIQELTGGASLKANIKLVKNNAAVGSKIAVALAAEDQA